MDPLHEAAGPQQCLEEGWKASPSLEKIALNFAIDPFTEKSLMATWC